jgi:hypothetical protein
MPGPVLPEEGVQRVETFRLQPLFPISYSLFPPAGGDIALLTSVPCSLPQAETLPS